MARKSANAQSPQAIETAPAAVGSPSRATIEDVLMAAVMLQEQLHGLSSADANELWTGSGPLLGPLVDRARWLLERRQRKLGSNGAA